MICAMVNLSCTKYPNKQEYLCPGITPEILEGTRTNTAEWIKQQWAGTDAGSKQMVSDDG